MTAATLEKPATETDTPDQCCAVARININPTRCEKPAAYRAFVNCGNGHARTREYCAEHVRKFGVNVMICAACMPLQRTSWVVVLEPIK